MPALIALVLSLCVATAALAQESPTSATPAAEQPSWSERIESWDRTAEAVESMLAKPNPTQESLSLLRQEVERQRAAALAAAESLTAEITPLEAQLEALVPKPAEGDEAAAPPPELTERRAALDQQITQARARLGEAQLAATRAASLSTRLSDAQRALFTKRLLSRGPSLSDGSTWETATQTATGLAQRAVDGVAAAMGQLSPTGEHAPLLIALVLGGVLFFVAYPRMRRWVEGLIDRSGESLRTRRKTSVALALLAVRAGPPSIIALALAGMLEQSGLLSTVGVLLVWRFAEGVALVATAHAAARAFFAPRTPTARMVDLAAGAWPSVHAATWFFGFVALDRLLVDTIDAAGGSLALMSLANAAAAMLAGPSLYAFIKRITAPSRARANATPHRPGDAAEGEESDVDARPDREVFESAASAARLLGLAIAIAIPASALLGYFALSRYLIGASALTLGLAAIFALIYVTATRQLSTRGPDGVEQRNGLGSVLVAMTLTLLSLPILAAIWGASLDDLQAVLRRLFDGVQIGELRLTLSDLIAAIAIAILGFWLTRFIQGLLRRAILPQTRLDTGVRTSLTTGVGYIGALLTILFAVSAVGLDLSNLAIVAGALSVGIGFGLQAIVNNFVSGVILLIERPIRVGDWISVGGAEGYVQRINVRATEIETFDRQSVIIPNSELISTHVINNTHRNLTGRVHCTVGVHYGADVDQVMDILREVAKAHPQVLRYPQPLVTFAGFGDSSLDFELRAFVRDVNWKLIVFSDLNVAILKALREADIEIPYPQRDLHVRSGLHPEPQTTLAERPALEATVEAEAAAKERRSAEG